LNHHSVFSLHLGGHSAFAWQALLNVLLLLDHAVELRACVGLLEVVVDEFFLPLASRLVLANRLEVDIPRVHAWQVLGFVVLAPADDDAKDTKGVLQEPCMLELEPKMLELEPRMLELHTHMLELESRTRTLKMELLLELAAPSNGLEVPSQALESRTRTLELELSMELAAPSNGLEVPSHAVLEQLLSQAVLELGLRSSASRLSVAPTVQLLFLHLAFL
jgi:hypothetical protein